MSVRTSWTNVLSCVHKMCEWTYGQTNMKRAITLAKINHPWNQYNMRILRSWPTKISSPWSRFKLASVVIVTDCIGSKSNYHTITAKTRPHKFCRISDYFTAISWQGLAINLTATISLKYCWKWYDIAGKLLKCTSFQNRKMKCEVWFVAILLVKWSS
jgi:hypothetical protein